MGTISFHASDETERTIRALAVQQGLGVSALVSQLLKEGLRMRRFPGIIFRTGPTGRRAGLAGTVDVWEAIAILDECGGDEAAVLAAYPTLTLPLLKTARAYHASYPEEIEARIAMSRLAEADVVAEMPALFLTSGSPVPKRAKGKARKRA